MTTPITQRWSQPSHAHPRHLHLLLHLHLLHPTLVAPSHTPPRWDEEKDDGSYLDVEGELSADDTIYTSLKYVDIDNFEWGANCKSKRCKLMFDQAVSVSPFIRAQLQPRISATDSFWKSHNDPWFWSFPRFIVLSISLSVILGRVCKIVSIVEYSNQNVSIFKISRFWIPIKLSRFCAQCARLFPIKMSLPGGKLHYHRMPLDIVTLLNNSFTGQFNFKPNHV